MIFLLWIFEVFLIENDFELLIFEEKIFLKIILFMKKRVEILNT